MKSLHANVQQVSSQQLQTKYCKVIDFEKETEKHASAKRSYSQLTATSVSCGNGSPAPIRGVFTSKVNLKYNIIEDIMYAPIERADKEPTEGRKRKRLSFDDAVAVAEIPMRCEYSPQVRKRLWSSASELQENAFRNMVEFSFEGRDWRTVIEDEKMYVSVATGELIHPCHYTNSIQM